MQAKAGCTWCQGLCLDIIVQITALAQERKIIQERIPDLHKHVNAHILTEKETTADIQKNKIEQETLQASIYELKTKKDKNDSTKKLITNTTTTITNSTITISIT